MVSILYEMLPDHLGLLKCRLTGAFPDSSQVSPSLLVFTQPTNRLANWSVASPLPNTGEIAGLNLDLDLGLLCFKWLVWHFSARSSHRY